MKFFNTALLALIPTFATAKDFTGGHTFVSASIDSSASNPANPSGVAATITNNDPTAANPQSWNLPEHGTNLQTFTLTVGAAGYSNMLAAVLGTDNRDNIMDQVKLTMTVDSQKNGDYTIPSVTYPIEDGDEQGSCLQDGTCPIASTNGMQDAIPAIDNAISCQLPAMNAVTTGDTIEASSSLGGTGFSANEIAFTTKDDTVCGWDVTYTTKYRVKLSFDDPAEGQMIGTDLTVVVTNIHTTSFAGFSRYVNIDGDVSYVTGDITQAVVSVTEDTDSTTSSSTGLASSITFRRTNTITCTGALIELGDCTPMAVCAFKYTASCLPDSTHLWASDETVTLTYTTLDRDQETDGAFYTENEGDALSPSNSKGAVGDNALHEWVKADKCSTTDASEGGSDTSEVNCLYLNGESSAVDLSDADSLSVSAAKFTPFSNDGEWQENNKAVTRTTELIFYVHYPTDAGASQVVEMRMNFAVAVTGADVTR